MIERIVNILHRRDVQAAGTKLGQNDFVEPQQTDEHELFENELQKKGKAKKDCPRLDLRMRESYFLQTKACPPENVA